MDPCAKLSRIKSSSSTRSPGCPRCRRCSGGGVSGSCGTRWTAGVAPPESPLSPRQPEDRCDPPGLIDGLLGLGAGGGGRNKGGRTSKRLTDVVTTSRTGLRCRSRGTDGGLGGVLPLLGFRCRGLRDRLLDFLDRDLLGDGSRALFCSATSPRRSSTRFARSLIVRSMPANWFGVTDWSSIVTTLALSEIALPGSSPALPASRTSRASDRTGAKIGPLCLFGRIDEILDNAH